MTVILVSKRRLRLNGKFEASLGETSFSEILLTKHKDPSSVPSNSCKSWGLGAFVTQRGGRERIPGAGWLA